MLFPRLRSEKVAPEGQLSMPKLEPQVSQPDKPEITNFEHQITNKNQITISKSHIRSNANYLEFGILVIVICLVFMICYLRFFITETSYETRPKWHSFFFDLTGRFFGRRLGWTLTPDTYFPLRVWLNFLRLNRYDTTILRYFYTFLKADFGKKQ